MKRKQQIFFLSTFLIINITGCDLLNIQSLNEVFMTAMNELEEVLDKNGNSIPLDNNTVMPPFIYRGSTQPDNIAPKDRKDSLYYLKTIQGELIGKWEIKELVKYNKRNNRYEYLLSNGKYIFIETDKYAIHTVSEQVDSSSDLKDNFITGKYVYAAEKPEGW